MPMIIPRGPCPSRVMVLGDFPTIEDEAKGSPFLGSTGFELDRLLREAGFDPTSAFITHALKFRPPGSDTETDIPSKKKGITSSHAFYRGKYVTARIIQSIELLEKEINLCQPDLIIAMGDVALWALTQEWGIESWRGSHMTNTLGNHACQVIPTYTPIHVFRQYELRPILVTDLRRAFRQLDPATSVPRPEYNFRVRPSLSEVSSTLSTLTLQVQEGPVELAIDIETRNNSVSCLGIAWTDVDAMCIPFQCYHGDFNYWTLEEEAQVVLMLRNLLCHPNARIIWQNGLFDAQHIFRAFHFLPNHHQDTMISQHVCFPGMKKGLDFLASMYSPYYLFWKEDGHIWERGGNEDDIWVYNCQDCCYTFSVANVLQGMVEKMGLQYPHTFQQRLFRRVFSMMVRGLRIDNEYHQKLIGELKQAKSEVQSWLSDAVGHEVVVSSPKQMADLFYVELGQKAIKNKKTGSDTTNAEALGKLADGEVLLKPLIDKIEELRSINVFLSTFLGEKQGKWKKGFLDIDGRMRSSFNVAGTTTYRLSSSENAFGTGCNLQNLPKGDKE